MTCKVESVSREVWLNYTSAIRWQNRVQRRRADQPRSCCGEGSRASVRGEHAPTPVAIIILGRSTESWSFDSSDHVNDGASNANGTTLCTMLLPAASTCPGWRQP